MTREDSRHSTDDHDLLNLAGDLAGLRTSDGDAKDKKVQQGAFGRSTVNSPDPVQDDDEQHQEQQPHAEGILDEPEGHEPAKEDCILFIGDLARGITEADLERAFSCVGKVVMVDVKRDKLTMRNLGYGFVQMSTRQEAEQAKERMQDVDILGRRIRVGWAQRNTALFIGDLDESVTIEDLTNAFSRFGPLLHDYTYIRTGKFGRYGAVKFESRHDAEGARREMNGVRLGNYAIRVAWHHTQPGGPASYHHQHYYHPQHGRPSFAPFCAPSRPNSVHVQFEADPNHVTVTEGVVHSLFSPFGDVVAVVLPQGPGILISDSSSGGSGSSSTNQPQPQQGACRRGYGFVHFAGTMVGRRCALEAIHALNGQTVNGIRLQVAFSKKPTGGPRPSSAPPGRMGRGPRYILMMDHHAGGVGNVAMGFRPVAMASPTAGGMGPLGGFGGPDGGRGQGGGGRDGSGSPWPMQGYAGQGPPPSSRGMPPPYFCGGPYDPYAAGGYNGGYPPQHQYYSAQGYGGYEPYPAYYYQSQGPQGGMGGPPPQDGPMASTPYGMQRPANPGAGGGAGGAPLSGHTSPAPVMVGGMEYPQQEYQPMPSAAGSAFHMEGGGYAGRP